jgi:transposase
VRSWVLPGNTADVSTAEKVRADLRDWDLGRAMFVADARMNSQTNREELARACGKYLLACRMANVAEIEREVLSKRGRYTVIRDNLHAKEVIRELDRLQVTEFFDLKNRVLMRNEISSETANILKKLKIQTPKQILEVKNIA